MAIAGEYTHDGALSVKEGIQCFIWYDPSCCLQKGNTYIPEKKR